ncbi:MAG: diaminopimelate decarboxylase [Acidimicrobiales bacterium]
MNVGTRDASSPIPSKLLPETATVDASGMLSLGGIPVRALAERYGTPLFVYDETHLRTQIRLVRDAFDGTVAYASKAFLCKAMASLVAEEGIHLDAASGGEIFVARAGGVPSNKIVFHGNNKSDEEIAYALSVGVGRIVVDSFDEIERIERIADRPVDVWIRVTPGIEAHTHEFVQTGQDDSKFGFNVANGDAERAISQARRSTRLRLRGIHAHIGSQIFALHSFEREVEVLGGLFASAHAEEINFGGGLGVPYLRDEDAPSLVDWATTVSLAARNLDIDDDTTLFIEPGRSIVATAGVTLYAAGTRKEIPGVRRYLSVDGGMSDNPRPVLYGSGYVAACAERLFAPHDTLWSIAGKHCESGDVIVKDVGLPSVPEIGEIIITPVTGAYGYAMSSNYNKVPRPAVVFVREGHARVVIRREGFEDLLGLDA